ncbi:MAG: HAD family phosphatase [Bacteroidia bacterium]|nr:HAD family phosphatase [Bacteroidia bacterium]
MTTKAVIFDFDGVIGDTMQDNYKAWQIAFNAYQFNLDASEYFQLEGMGRFQIAQYFIEKYALNPNIKNEVVEAKEEIYKKINDFKIYNYVDEIFELLTNQHIKTAIVTGASKDRIQKYLSPKIAEQLTAIVTADDVKNTKPHPEPYLKAIEKLGVSATNCIVIENAILGIQSAKQAGCTCFALETTLSKEHLNEADLVFNNHFELLNHLKEYEF